jgi:hypothetical protein
MNKNTIWAEMARRKVQFHPTESWETITLWGLFDWGCVSKLITSGELLTNYTKENRTVWVRPSKETWETKISPLIQNHPLSELMTLAGW